MIALDYTVLVKIVSFLFLWFILARLLFTPFLALHEEREKRTEGVKAETASLSEEGERLRLEYDNGMLTARGEGNALKEAILQEGRETRERLLAQAREEAARLLQVVREDVQKEIDKGLSLASQEAQVIGRQMAEKLLGRGIG